MRFVSIALMALSFVALGACTKTEDHTSHADTVSESTPPAVAAGTLQITDAAFRAPLGNNANTAAYLTLTNTGSEDDRLLSAACDCADKVEIHTMTHENGVMKMEALPDGLELKAGETAHLTPGGHHIMLIGLKTRPTAGSTQPLTLTFAQAGTVTVDFPVVEQVSSNAHSDH